MTEIKQVIVVRTKYPDGKGGFFKPRIGKLMAQVAHSSMMFLVGGASIENDELSVHVYPVEQEWLKGSYTKVVVSVDSEDGLWDIAQKASEAGIEVHMVKDMGKTEFHGEETLTCVALGPDYSAKLDKITGHLKLM